MADGEMADDIPGNYFFMWEARRPGWTCTRNHSPIAAPHPERQRFALHVDLSGDISRSMALRRIHATYN